MIVKSQDLKGTFTHVIDKKYVQLALEGKNTVQEKTGLFFKPAGIWISWNHGWEKWCKSEGYSNAQTPVILKVKLKPNLKILLIDSYNDIKRVWDRYCMKSFGVKKSIQTYNPYEMQGFWIYLKDNKYQGVALTNTGQWKTRYNTFLYGWDCESLVIFNPRNVDFFQ